ncbi:MAG TPA: YceI family protein [Steroidobacteraceae bacterium]|nr:YceI family protein [Steroidobacteraceae bacterium]
MPRQIYAAIGLSTLILSACRSPAPRQPTFAAGASARPPAAAAVYRIDAARSQLRVLAYRAGPLADVGHDHVIVNRALGGWVAVATPISASSFFIHIPTAAFVVDAAAARRQEGPGFAAPLPAAAISATRRHMQSAALLDAYRHPSIDVRSLQIAGAAPRLTATVLIHIAGHAARLTLPFTVDLEGARLSATAAFGLRQTALGLAPYSILLGALRVRDELRVKLKIVAESH